MLRAIEDFIEETKFSRVMDAVQICNDFRRKDAESAKEFIGRFSILKSKLKNTEAGMSNTWMAAFLMDRSKLLKAEKNNILATINTDNECQVLKDMEKKIKETDATENKKDANETLYGQNNWKKKWNNRRYRDERGRSSCRCSEGRDGNVRDYRSFSKRREEYKNQKDVEKDKIDPGTKRTFFVNTLKIDNNKTIFYNKVENKALVDSGCPESVAGLSWLKTYESSM